MKAIEVLHDEYEIPKEANQIQVLQSEEVVSITFIFDESYRSFHIHIQLPAEGKFLFLEGSPLRNAERSCVLSLEPFTTKSEIRIILLRSTHDHEELAVVDTVGHTVLRRSDGVTVRYGFAPRINVRRLLPVAELKQNLKYYGANWPRNIVRNDVVARSSKAKSKIVSKAGSLVPVPGVVQRKRIHGHFAVKDLDGSQFLTGGMEVASEFFNIANLFGVKSESRASVLDWGVGCGRLARHVPVAWREKFYGIDIDPKNIEWCRENFDFGEFFCLPPYPKGKILSGKVDLVYSYSVMTHLVGADQMFWLEKLAEVCGKDTILIISVHGLLHACNYDWSSVPEALSKFLIEGVIGGDNQNPDIADVSPAGYYTDISNTPKYIHENWSRVLNILDIIPGGVGGHDAVVARIK